MELQAAPTILVNARLGDGRLSSLRFLNGRIVSLGGRAQAGDLVIDLHQDLLLPGLINAHDHLQLNSLGAEASGKHYSHVRDWIADIDLRRRSDRQFQAQIAQPRETRLLIGGIKNLLSGVTTVAHHDPLYARLVADDFPVSVLRHYGWSHSLEVDGDSAVHQSYLNTPSAWPWMIHAAEGVNDEAATEFSRLEALGCIGSNTRLIHGIALTQPQRSRLQRAGGALVWCPSSNLRLFDRTANIGELANNGLIALGSDSRLSGARDLLEELAIARQVGGVDAHALQKMVTSDCARLLGLTDRGSLLPGLRADLVVLPAGAELSQTHRAEVRLVIINGVARYGDREYTQCAAPASDWMKVRVDGCEKSLHPVIGEQLRARRGQDAGLELADSRGRAA
jgi:cytosine/adenosine deaminase-related metal-dependent hydrolase